ncbi:MAG: hypothetical protein JSU07_08275 [Bacteroidetes bacterium]|nr:hypothetical protein [Bacteroidota bacterium]
MKHYKLIIIKIILACSTANAQNEDVIYSTSHLYFNIGANVSIGTHFIRYGLNFNFSFVSGNLQANTQIKTYFNFKNLGPKLMYPEIVLSQALLVCYGKQKNFNNPFFSILSNQSKFENSFGYAYNIYLNKINTSQVTGIIAMQFNRITLLSENDIFAKPMLDRFRTGAFLIQYQLDDKYIIGLNNTMWTGKMGNRIETNLNNTFSKCYLDTTKGVYSNYSHGLLSLQFMMSLNGGQFIQLNSGIDAEQVRNAVQNKFIHDMPFLPKKYNKNCHIPMIDSKGQQYLYGQNQKIKKVSPYINFFSGASIFY